MHSGGKRSTAILLCAGVVNKFTSTAVKDNDKIMMRQRKTEYVLGNRSYSMTVYLFLAINEPKDGWKFVRISQSWHHEDIVPLPTLSEDSILKIKLHAYEGIDPFQICFIRQEIGVLLSWSQVYYCWAKIMKENYQRSANIFLSCRILLESLDKLELCYFTEQPRANGFLASDA